MKNNEFKLGMFAIACVSIIAIFALSVTAAIGQDYIVYDAQGRTVAVIDQSEPARATNPIVERANQARRDTTVSSLLIKTENHQVESPLVCPRPLEIRLADAEAVNLSQDVRNVLYGGLFAVCAYYTNNSGMDRPFVQAAKTITITAGIDNIVSIIRRHKKLNH